MTLAKKMFHGLRSGIADLLYPPSCCFCQQEIAAGTQRQFCSSCLSELRRLQSDQCQRCAAPFPSDQSMAVGCPICRKESYTFSRALAFGRYDGLLRESILRMKQMQGEALGAQLANLFVAEYGDQLRAWSCAAVVPVPLHWTRRLWRGYNQAAVIAQVLAAKFGITYRPSWLWRFRQTPMQTAVSPAERHHNLRNAFRAQIPDNYQNTRVLLVDDVMTTGSTGDACARVLKHVGAGEVCLAVLARAIG